MSVFGLNTLCQRWDRLPSDGLFPDPNSSSTLAKELDKMHWTVQVLLPSPGYRKPVSKESQKQFDLCYNN